LLGLPSGRTLGVVTSENEDIEHELIVAADGSIPADQLARLGVEAGTHLRVVSVDDPVGAVSGILSLDVSTDEAIRAMRGDAEPD
jgi:hypothetical protein